MQVVIVLVPPGEIALRTSATTSGRYGWRIKHTNKDSYGYVGQLTAVGNLPVVEFFVDGQSVGSVSVVVNPNADGKVAKVSVQNTVIQRDGVLNITVEQAEANSPVYFSARGMKTETSGPVDAAGVCDGTGKLNFSYRFTVAGEYVLFIEISGKLYTDTLKVQPISTLDKLIEEYPAGTRAYTKYEG